MKVAVLGGGAWGTALALVAGRGGHDVRLWARDPEIVASISQGESARYLPGVALGTDILAATDPAQVLAGADMVLVVTPAQALRDTLMLAASRIPNGVPLVLCAKGIERGSGKLLSAIAVEILPGNPVAALSGPSFASDVARGLPTAVAIAARSEALAADLAQKLSNPTFRCYSTDDLVGVEIGGALKNVLAIAAGAVAGAGLGASAQAALVTRGFVELRRLGQALGARAETLMGLSGLGDLVLTCASAQSRNFAYGVALGRGEPLAGRPLAEGVATAATAATLARERGIEAPIIDAAARLLDGRLTVVQAIAALMSRPLRSESD